MKFLDDNLKSESDEVLLKRSYKYWCNDENQYKAVCVKKIISMGLKQLNKYVNTLEHGRANIEKKKNGICENRMVIEEGISHLRGFLISSFGSQRLLVKETNIKKINFQYFIKK